MEERSGPCCIRQPGQFCQPSDWEWFAGDKQGCFKPGHFLGAAVLADSHDSIFGKAAPPLAKGKSAPSAELRRPVCLKANLACPAQRRQPIHSLALPPELLKGEQTATGEGGWHGKAAWKNVGGQSGKTVPTRPFGKVIQGAVVASLVSVGVGMAGYLRRVCSPIDGALVPSRRCQRPTCSTSSVRVSVSVEPLA